MAELTLPPDLVRRIQEIAQQEHRPVDEVIESLLTRYRPAPPRLTQAEQATLLRQDKLRTYERARRYWHTTGDERQNLTDEQLDEQFWLFDQDGVPHLKSDQATIALPPNPFKQMLDLTKNDTSVHWSGPHDSSERTKEILNTEYTNYLLSRMSHPASDKDE